MALKVLIVGHPDALGMELLGVHDIVWQANEVARRRGLPAPYAIQLGTYDGQPIRLAGGLQLGPVRALADCRGPLDTLIVVGGPETTAAAGIDALVDEVRRLAKRARRVASVCTGAFILAATGLLDGRPATTHWAFGKEFAERFPTVDLDTNPIFIRSGTVWTSAGVTAGFDMMLEMVEADVGSDIAREVAAMGVMYVRRPGNQAQFAPPMAVALTVNTPLRDLQRYIAENPAADLSLTTLADRMHMSPRHFARVFSASVGLPPGRYVEMVRLETSRRLLECADLDFDAVVHGSGFPSAAALRRAFTLHLDITPTDYRRRFSARPTLHLVG